MLSPHVELQIEATCWAPLQTVFLNNASSDAMIKLYTAVIRPQLECATEVWDPHLQKNVELLENVQKQALRMCSRQWDLSYHTLLVSFLYQI